MVSTGDSAGAGASHNLRPESGLLLPLGMAEAKEVSLLLLWVVKGALEY